MCITHGWTHLQLCEQVDAALFGDGVVCVELHQSVEGAEGIAPQVILTVPVSHHFKVLHVILMSDVTNTYSIKNRVCVHVCVCVCV